MRDGDTFRIHAPVLNRLPAVLRVLVGCAGVLRGGTEGADFIDIKMDGRRVAFIACADAAARLPVYTEQSRAASRRCGRSPPVRGEGGGDDIENRRRTPYAA